MRSGRLIWAACASAVGACALSVVVNAADGTIADAVMAGDRAAVVALIKQGADVNAAQGDGVTALHWAARRGDAELTDTLIVAGGNVRATSRFGRYTPLHLAAERGSAAVIARLLKAGAPTDVRTNTGTTPLMMAAAAGDLDAISALIDGGADVNATETEREHTPLIFAAASNRLGAVKLLIARGADPNAATKVVDLAALSRNGANPDGRNLAAAAPDPRRQASPAPAAAAPAPRVRMPGMDRQYLINEQVHAHGGMTPLLYAARQGYADVAMALLDAGVDVNQRKGGDNATALLAAAVNGQFDLAGLLLDRGADPNLVAENGVGPLYAAINVQWAPRAGYPQPRAHLNQKLSYVEFMKRLLDKGADPNARVNKKVWWSNYNFDQSGVDEVGSTAFWRAAYGADVEVMKLLVAYGADPHISTAKPPERPETGDVGRRETRDISGLPPIPTGGPGVPPLLAAAGVGYGEGFAGNSHRFAPSGMLAAVQYLVEVVGANVNARDHEGNTALHHAASRGDTEMIQYLVSKGADVTTINREGQTTVDMANGAVQRVQPWPETIALLEKLGAKNNHKCLSC
ncbi:MAG: ankyrin repeat domain-containing protein [Acidobacteria bacterium]|nr:ankyrin repeat domain-containing protein [Acidobacteriota bacterium]